MSAHAADRLRRLQPEIEVALADALRDLTDHAAGWPAFEREMSLDDLLALSDGRDAMYDRPTVGVMYALWYHAERTHDAVRALLPVLLKMDGDLTLFDVGAGTGATWWACGLIERCRLEAGGPRRGLRIVAVETSLPMLQAADRMWQSVLAGSLFGSALIDVDPNRAPLSSMPRLSDTTIAYAGYFFDASDATRVDDVADLLASTLEGLGASSLILAGSRQKAPMVTAALSEILRRPGWSNSSSFVSELPIWGGHLEPLQKLRRVLTVGFSSEKLRALGAQAPTWRSTSSFNALEFVEAGQSLLPFTPAEAELRLDPHQEAAAIPARGSRPTVVVGSAGSGKSRILIERLARTIEQTERGQHRQILVTTFNRNLRDQLVDWVPATLRRSVISEVNRPRLTRADAIVDFLTWDQVVRDILTQGGKQRLSDDPKDDVEIFRGRLASCDESLRPFVAANHWLTAEFLAAELKRVVYGLTPCTLDAYLAVARRGMRRRLDQGQRRRIWKLLMESEPDSWTYRRIKALAVCRSTAPRRYTNILVDECQDFTSADFEMLRYLLRPAGELVVFGDTTQGLHIGGSYGRPRVFNGHRWQEHQLERSYRLPLRVCEAVAPIAHRLEAWHRSGATRGDASGDDGGSQLTTDLVKPRAVKNAVVGVRPIMLAGTRTQVIRQLDQVLTYYQPLLPQRREHNFIVSVAEEAETDSWLSEALSKMCPEHATVQRETMVKIKGLERPVVVWATGAPIRGLDTYPEWIYTICTRTTALLVIILEERTPNEIRRVVQRFDRSRLMFWTEDAQAMFDSWREPMPLGSSILA